MQGQIIKIISNLFFVYQDDIVYPCRSRGLFRNQSITPVVGDYCIIDKENNYIMEILPRKNFLVRPLIANIDQGLIVTSLREPDFSANLLDKFLVVLEYNNIKPIICLTKRDLLTNKDEFLDIKKYYENIGYDVIYNDEEERLKNIFKDKTTVFTGQTGSGKSSLFNRLEPSLEFKTGDISKALGRGKHTTRHVELVMLFGGKLVDTPGFSSVDLSSIPDEGIRDAFLEFSNYKCRYRGCMHTNETTSFCGVREAVKENKIMTSRYENYLKFLKNNERSY